MTPTDDPLAGLRELVRDAAREGAAQALAAVTLPTAPPADPLLDKRALAHALGVSTAKVDRLCREGRIPFVRVGEVRRFDLAAVRAALEAGDERERDERGKPPADAAPPAGRVAGVRLLSRRSP